MMGSMMRRAMLGDGSTLSLDFTKMSTLADLTSMGVSFSRSTSGTFINASGLVATATAGNPRFSYDTNGNPRGLLIESAQNNLALQSNGAVSVWVIGTGRTPTNNTTDLLSPDGTNNATKLVCGTAGGYASHAQIVSGLTGGATYTVSYWIRGPVGHAPRLYAVNGTVGDVTPTSTTGTYNNTSWTRITQTYTLPATTTQVYVYFLSATIGATGDTFYVYGFQLETGSGASSLIPSGASAGNRALDSCYIAGANFTSWFRTGAGTVVAHSDNVCNVGAGSQNLLCNFSNSGTDNYIRMGWRVAGVANELLLTSVSGTTQGSPDSGFNPAFNTAYKTAYAWDTNNFAICANGGAVVTDTTGTLAGAGVIDSVTLGGDFYQTSGPNSIYMKNGHIRSWRYYPTRLTNAQLQSLTT